jgi:hypothetical protein
MRICSGRPQAPKTQSGKLLTLPQEHLLRNRWHCAISGLRGIIPAHLPFSAVCRPTQRNVRRAPPYFHIIPRALRQVLAERAVRAYQWGRQSFTTDYTGFTDEAHLPIRAIRGQVPGRCEVARSSPPMEPVPLYVLFAFLVANPPDTRGETCVGETHARPTPACTPGTRGFPRGR